MSVFRCIECFQGAVAPTAESGRVYLYKGNASVPIPDDFLIPTCDRCGEEYLDEETIDRLVEALEKSYRERLV